MKAVLPTLRQKKRYVVFEIVSESAIPGYGVTRSSIIGGCLSYLGELGFAESGIRLLDQDYDTARQRGIIRVGHRHVERLSAALAMIRRIGPTRALIRCLGVSGILNKAEERYLIEV